MRKATEYRNEHARREGVADFEIPDARCDLKTPVGFILAHSCRKTNVMHADIKMSLLDLQSQQNLMLTVLI